MKQLIVIISICLFFLSCEDTTIVASKFRKIKVAIQPFESFPQDITKENYNMAKEL